jgi:hypothetical protein
LKRTSRQIAEQLGTQLTYARVMATLAIALVALGSGYSLAFSGSGTLQKGGKQGITTGTDTIRTVSGVGSVTATCDPDGLGSGPQDLRLRLVNGSGETLSAYVYRARTGSGVAADPLTFSIPDAGIIDPVDAALPAEVGEHIRIHVFPADGTKRPQAEILVSANTNSEGCSNDTVHVLDLTTEGG